MREKGKKNIHSAIQTSSLSCVLVPTQRNLTVASLLSSLPDLKSGLIRSSLTTWGKKKRKKERKYNVERVR